MRITVNTACRIEPLRDVNGKANRRPEIVERLLTVEQAHAELVEQQARLQFELFELQQQQSARQTKR